MKKSTKLLFLVLCIISALNVKSQTDNEFWFAAPDISNNHGNNGRPLYLHMSAVRNTTVTIEKPSDLSFTPIIKELAAGQAFSLQLDDSSLFTTVPSDIEVSANANPALGVQSKGFKVTSSPGEITCFYELNAFYNRDIFPLKGLNALGNKFTITTQNIFNNSSGYADARSGFVVLSTEANTTVGVYLPEDVAYVGFPTGGYQEITLPNAGDAFAFRVVSRFAANHPAGVLVECIDPTKEIAITVWDDSMAKTSNEYGNGGCLDSYGDQLVPDALLGRNYLVMRGQLGIDGLDGNWRNEYAFITAIEDNTEVYVDGVLDTTINTGEVFSHIITNRYTKIYTSNPSSVTQITGSGQGCEQGGAMLPTTDDCAGSHEVTFTHGNPASDNYHLNIMVRNDISEPGKALDGINNFYLKVNGTSVQIPASFFEFPYAPADSSWACLIDDFRSTEQTVYKWIQEHIPYSDGNDSPTVATISNDSARFHLAVLQGNSTNGAKYGYFSDYASSSYSAGVDGAFASQRELYCNLDSFQVVAVGGETYNWTCKDALTGEDLSYKFSDATSSAPYFKPDTAGVYSFEVYMTSDCYADTTIELQVRVIDAVGSEANFTISDKVVCSPNEALITNTTDSSKVVDMYWTITGLTDTFYSNEMPSSFYYDFVNTSDTTQEYTIRLLSSLEKNSCPSIKIDTVTVYPQNDSTAFNFTELSSNCEGKTVLVENTSVLDNESSFVWNFGDGTTSTDMDVEYSYARLTEMDTSYSIVLKSVNTYGCVDSTTMLVDLLQIVNADFTSDYSEGCSPFTVSFTNNSGGRPENLTYKWIVDESLVMSTENIEHTFATYSLSNSISTVQLIVVDSTNCSDTASSTILVHPTPLASFELTPSEGTAPLETSFTNYSMGADTYNWEFGTGETSNETNPVYTYNPDSTSTFVVTLTANTDWCEDSLSKTVDVLVNPSSIHTLIDDENINYFYNSKFEELMVELDLNESSTLKLSVYNLLGALVIEKETLSLSAGNYHESISMQGEQDGVFILKLQVNEKITSGIFIKK